MIKPCIVQNNILSKILNKVNCAGCWPHITNFTEQKEICCDMHKFAFCLLFSHTFLPFSKCSVDDAHYGRLDSLQRLEPGYEETGVVNKLHFNIYLHPTCTGCCRLCQRQTWASSYSPVRKSIHSSCSARYHVRCSNMCCSPWCNSCLPTWTTTPKSNTSQFIFCLNSSW